MKCNQCGNIYEGKFCDRCGAQNSQIVFDKKKKPFYKRWWFILLVIVAVAAILLNGGDDKKEKKSVCNVDTEWIEGFDTDTPEVTNGDISTDPVPEQTEAPAPETVPITTPVTTPPETEKPIVDNVLDPGFKAAMDSYEAFVNEYVDFMKKYNSNRSDFSLLVSYGDYVSKYAKFVKDFEKWKDEDMNAVETAYYIDVQARVSKKLLEIAG